MTEINDKENRQFIRHPSDISIEVQLADVAVSAQEYLSNISLGGVSFKSKVFLDIGRIIYVTIPLVKPVFKAKGCVVWCTFQGEYFDVGVEFIDVSDAFKARMVEQVCHIEQYKKEVYEKEGRVLTGTEAALEWIAKYADRFPAVKE